MAETARMVRQSVIAGRGAGPLQLAMMVLCLLGATYFGYGTFESLRGGYAPGAELVGTLMLLALAVLFGRALIAVRKAAKPDAP